MFDPIARSSGGSLSYYQSVGAFEDMAGRVWRRASVNCASITP